ncbi:MAG: signal peptide peptidase SppA [Ignavibacteriota bacterium]
MSDSNQNKSGRWFWGIIIGILVMAMLFVGFSIIIFATALVKTGDKGYDYEEVRSGKGKIAIVELDFTIIDSKPIVRQFKKYREDKSIKAIVLHVNSPGGGVAASQEMYEEVKKTRDAGIPVIVSFGSIAASGGYYVACGGSLIVSNPGTLTGSIGVIISLMNFKELTDKLGIKDFTIKSGELKDAGNPMKEINEKDRAYFQDIVDDSYEQFLDVVSKERKIDKEEVRRIASGRVYTGRQAKDIRLVDSLGTLEDAIKIAGVMAKIEGEPAIVKEKGKRNIFDYIIENMTNNEIKVLKEDVYNEFLNKPVLQYKFER